MLKQSYFDKFCDITDSHRAIIDAIYNCLY